MKSRIPRYLYRRLPARYERALVYHSAYGRVPRLPDARLWSEKINLRILFDRRPVIAMMADKLAARAHVHAVLPALRMPELLWSGTDLSRLAGAGLPDRWVLKPNHRSGDVYFGRGPATDLASLEKATAGWLDEYGGYYFEWAYSRARRLLLVEEMLGDGAEAPDDYKLYAFDGRVVFVQHDYSRFSDHAQRYYTPQWQPVHVCSVMPEAPLRPPPAALEEMLAAAGALSKGIDFVRIDFYDVGGVAYFGELTAYPGSGLTQFEPASDAELGDAWVLPPELVQAAAGPRAVEAARRALELALVARRSARARRGPG